MFTKKQDHRDDLIRRLMQQNADLQDRLMEMIGTVHAYQVAHHARDKELPAPFSIPAGEASHVTEDELDLMDLEADGQIDQAAMIAAIREAGIHNIEFGEE